MTEEFLAVFKIIGWKGIEEGGHRVPTEELIRQMRADPAALEWERSFLEHILTMAERPAGETLLRLLFSTTCYLSNLLEGPVPVLLPRGNVQALHTADDDGHGAQRCPSPARSSTSCGHRLPSCSSRVTSGWSPSSKSSSVESAQEASRAIGGT